MLWLAVENDDNDFFLMRRAFSRVAPSLGIHRCKDGLEAKTFLAGNGSFTTPFVVPSLIISDLKMPHLDGIEFLAWTKEQPLLCKVPFIMLSNSNSQVDRQKALALNVTEYLVKPARFADLLKLAQGLMARFGGPLPGEIRTSAAT